MSTLELKQRVAGLSPQERLYLTAYLKIQERIADAAQRGELSRRMREMDGGHVLVAGAVRDLHQSLESKGL